MVNWGRAYITAARVAFLIISWAMLGFLVGFLLADPLARFLEPFIPFALIQPAEVRAVAEWMFRPVLLTSFVVLFALIGGLGALVKLTVDLSEQLLKEEEEKLVVEVLALSRSVRRLEEEVYRMRVGGGEARGLVPPGQPPTEGSVVRPHSRPDKEAQEL